VTSLLIGCDEQVARWVVERIPHVDDFGPSVGIGVVNEGRMLAGIVYHDYQPENQTIQLSMAAASPMWARRPIIAGLLKYPFEQLGVYKVWTGTPADNEKALKVNKHIGFKQEAILAHHFGPKRHGIVCRMLAPDYYRIYGGA
jgi:RimJ/RimL family protein N-acetyltransferase